MKKYKRNNALLISLLVTIVLIAIYIVVLKNSSEQSTVSESVLTILGIVAGVAFWLEYHHNNKLNEAEFIVELNKQFITDVNMTRVEHDLEKYYAIVRRVEGDNEETEQYLEMLRDKYEINKPERQWLVNYLVHLEGIAALINTGVIRLKSINDLMAYRFFISVNNPVVQELELYPYSNYYNGIFDLFDEWKDYYGVNNIPLSQHLLDKQKRENVSSYRGRG